MSSPSKEIPKFSRFSFTNAQVSGANIGTYTVATGLYEAVQTTNGMAPPAGKIDIRPGALIGESSFSLTWVRA